MRIGYTPGQVDALREMRAEQTRLEKRALTRRGLLSLFLGGTIVFVAGRLSPRQPAGKEPETRPDESQPSEGPALRWARRLERSGSDTKLIQNWASYCAIVMNEGDGDLRLWQGVRRFALLLLEGKTLLDAPEQQKAARVLIRSIQGGDHPDSLGLHELTIPLQRLLR